MTNAHRTTACQRPEAATSADRSRQPTSRLAAAWLTLVLALGAPAPVPAAAQNDGRRPDPAGAWEGLARFPDAPLALEIVLERADGDRWTGVFSVPAEGVRVPIGGVDVRADSVILTITPTRIIRGRVAGDSIAGEVDFDGERFPVLLARPGTPTADRLRAERERMVEAARAAPLEQTARGPGGAHVDADALDRLVEAADAAHSHALVVLHDGDLVGEWHAGGDPRPIEAMSVTKSIVSLAVGRLVTTGAIESIDAPVHHYFPEWADGDKARVTIRHLLNHTSGLAADRTTEAIYASDDFVRYALESELTAEPGTEVFYNNNATNLLAGLVGRAAGRRMDEFLRRDLFARLGITDFDWALDDAGNPHGMAGLRIRAGDLAKLGQLVLDRGEWEGERLIDPAFIDESVRPGSELNDGVGLLWWLIREDDGSGEIVGYRADGYLGQYIVIYPRERLVAVRMVESSPAYDGETDGFRDFPDYVRALARSEP